MTNLQQEFQLPDRGLRALARDIRFGDASMLIRVILSMLAALAVMSAVTLWWVYVERRDGWIRDGQIAVSMMIAASVWILLLVPAWRTAPFRALRRVITHKRVRPIVMTSLMIGMIWAVFVPAIVMISSKMEQGDGRGPMTTTGILMCLTVSLSVVIARCYNRSRPLTRSSVQLRLRCPCCNYSLRGLHHCLCPECGAQFTLEQLINLVGRGRVTVENSMDGPDNAGVDRVSSSARYEGIDRHPARGGGACR